MRRSDSFQVDFSIESHLILPFYTLPPDAIVYREGDDVFIRSSGYLFSVSDRDEVDAAHFIEDRSLHHIVFPSRKERTHVRYLMKRTAPAAVYTFLDRSLDNELFLFYQERTSFDVDEEYLDRRRAQGEVFFIERKDGRIVSAAYSVKERRQTVSLATDRDMKKRGLASSLLESVSIPYLFCETERLREFYEKRGFSVVRRYAVINR